MSDALKRNRLVSCWLRAQDLPVNIPTAARLMRIPAKSTAARDLESRLHHLYQDNIHAFSPRYQLGLFIAERASLDGDRIVVGNGAVFSGKALSRRFGKQRAEHLAVFIATAGDPGEAVQQDLLAQFEFHLLGSILVQAVVQHLCVSLASTFNSGEWQISAPLLPGNPGWPLQQQSTLFSVLAPHNIGVHLNTNQFIAPKHSLSGLIAMHRLNQ